ncbi:hypothetical protein [Pseudooceanicola aestuarii]|uniref:hypothetical protein n=1 Tax=Pseudooceanicola aestuarii TaxID=2697319 RepID=UPI0013D5D6B0|nr:hypothetical protein [Pseudooceanicola aestuarii]
MSRIDPPPPTATPRDSAATRADQDRGAQAQLGSGGASPGRDQFGQARGRTGPPDPRATSKFATRLDAAMRAGAQTLQPPVGQPPGPRGTQAGAHEEEEETKGDDRQPGALLAALPAHAPPAPASTPPPAETRSQIASVVERIATDLRAAEAQMLRPGADGKVALRMDLPVPALGVQSLELAFSAKELVVTLHLPPGAEAHNLAQASAVLAQALAARYPARAIRIQQAEDRTAEDTAPDTAAFDPLRPGGMRR